MRKQLQCICIWPVSAGTGFSETDAYKSACFWFGWERQRKCYVSYFLWRGKYQDYRIFKWEHHLYRRDRSEEYRCIRRRSENRCKDRKFCDRFSDDGEERLFRALCIGGCSDVPLLRNPGTLCRGLSGHAGDGRKCSGWRNDLCDWKRGPCMGGNLSGRHRMDPDGSDAAVSR